MLYPATKNALEMALENYTVQDLELQYMALSINFQTNHPAAANAICRNLWHIPEGRQRLSRPFITSAIAYLIKTKSIVF